MVDGLQNILAPESFGEFAARQIQDVDAVETPWPTLNLECKGDGGRRGLAFGWHVIMAGATKMGKSMLAMNLAASAAKQGHAVAFVSLEMARHQIQQRVYAILTGEDADEFSRGTFKPDMIAPLHAMMETVNVPPLLLVNDRPVRDIHHIIRTLDEFQSQFGCRIFVVDYLQLCTTGREEDMRQQVAEISAQLMGYAHANEALTVGISQLNRETTKDRKASPLVEGMIGTSSLENDADMVLLLDHSKYEKDTQRPWLHRTWLKIGASRHGGNGKSIGDRKPSADGQRSATAE